MYVKRYVKSPGKNNQQLQTEWTGKMLCDILMCKEKAIEEQISMAKRNIKLSYMNIMHTNWLRLYPDSDFTAKNLQARCYMSSNGNRQHNTYIYNESYFLYLNINLYLQSY